MGVDGEKAVTIKSVKKVNKGGFGLLSQTTKANKFKGKRVRFTAFLKTKDVKENGYLWCRVDGSNLRQFHLTRSSEKNYITRNTDWKKCVEEFDVYEDAKFVLFGVMMYGNGQIWMKEPKLEIVEDLKSFKDFPDSTITDEPTNMDFLK
ncbi:MAG: hypothetical protein NTX03_04940 [Bacteroidetes bacterium]|nr:hypothetical protein [Bacteroidota bacterium]